MDFRIHCECGEAITVSEGAAGARRDCRCGRTVNVPSLTDLRMQADLPPQPPNPTVVIADMTAMGELPTLALCARCDRETADSVVVTVDCEIQSAGDSMGIGFVFLFLFLGIWAVVLSLLQKPSAEHGDSRIVHCPMRLCRGCQSRLANNYAMWIWLAVAQIVFALVVVALWSDWGALLIVSAALTLLLGFVVRRRKESSIKRLLAREPIYEILLNDFPKAKVRLNVD